MMMDAIRKEDYRKDGKHRQMKGVPKKKKTITNKKNK
ncbi:MAG: hypothetical protein RLZZ118_648 [Bacteroidota bacterium]|jgi:hypothetical protein